jgi:glycosyltransferase
MITRHTSASTPCAPTGILVSIVTVNYNGASTLPRLLSGVGTLLDGNPDFEHVIIDGESSDDSVRLFKEHASRHANVILISERDHGIYDAMNKGVRKVRGRYFIHLNSDDQAIHPERWQTMAARLREQAPLILVTPVPIMRQERTLRVLPGRPYSRLHRRFGYHFPHQGTFFARELFERTNGYSTAIGYIADKIFCYQLLDELSDVQVEYRVETIAVQYAGGISSSSSLTPFKTLWLALKSARHVRYRNPWVRALLNPVFKIVNWTKR